MTTSATDFDRTKAFLKDSHNQMTIAVIGDFMLDHYILGDVQRISPEAPVPIVKIKEERYVAGGAGNVAANLHGLGVRFIPIGNIGDDEGGKKLLSLPLFKDFVNREPSSFLNIGPTTVKTRILGSGYQQMLRLDYESTIKIDEIDIHNVISLITNATKDLKLIILSDYEKGFCSEALCKAIINYARNNNISVWIDPKKKNWDCYRGASVITPNIQELSLAYGNNLNNNDDEIVTAGKLLQKKYDIGALFITRSEKGATFITRQDIFHFPVGKAEVFDVSGAGDTMIATAGALVAAGIPIAEAIQVANMAAQIVISRAGTFPISASLLLEKIYDNFNPNPKLKSTKEASSLCKKWQSESKKVIFTNGCFDILHAGHIDSLKMAKSLGDKLIVGLNSDDSITRLKGESRPINNICARLKVLASIEYIDIIVIFEEDTPYQLLSSLQPNIIVKGGDYRAEEVAGKEFADEVVILPLTDGFSTTSLIEKVNNKE